MFIRTERLFLRPGWPEDEAEFVEAAGREKSWGHADSRRAELFTLPRSSSEFRTYLKRPRDVRLPGFLVYLRQRGDPSLVGGVGLGQCGKDVGLAYWIADRHRGHGYGAEAVRAVLAQARALGHRRVVAMHFADGDESPHVLEQAGFRCTGETQLPVGPSRSMSRPVRLYAAVLADKIFDLLGGSAHPAPA